ncbi:sialidase family protein [Actinopolymorpha pittospori]
MTRMKGTHASSAVGQDAVADVTVYTSGTHGYDTFRIPALVRATDGTLLAFAEGRRNGPGDAGAIDVVLRRSGDDGRTWGPLVRVATDGDDTVGNPCPVVDPVSGDIVLLTVRASADATEERILAGEVGAAEGRRIWSHRGSDHGLHWSAPVDVTAQVKRPGWRWYATGPGHGVALRSGPFAGRLVIPANHSTAETGYGGHLLLSDDGGRSWRIGAEDPGTDGQVKPNESAAAELPDGRLYFNTRNQGGLNAATRAHTTSVTGGDSFDGPYAPAPQLVAPVVQCGLVAVGANLVFSGPADPKRRRGLTVRLSEDAGQTWDHSLVIWPGPSAYSDLAVVPRERAGEEDVAVLYEAGAESAYEQIRFVRVPLAALTRA